MFHFKLLYGLGVVFWKKNILLAFICLKEKPYSPSHINTEWKFLIEFLKCLRRNVVKAYFDTYCVQYLHAMPFLNFFFRIFTLKNVYICLLFRKVSSSNCHIFTKMFFTHTARPPCLSKIWDDLRDLLPFVQFKKHKKHPRKSYTFSKVSR